MEPPSDRYKDFTLERGYVFAGEVVRLRRSQGEKTVGRKIGFTNRAVWQDCGLDTLIWANVYHGSVHLATAERVEVPLEGTCLPRIEPEVVFKVRKVPLPDSQEPAELLPCLEWLALGFGIVDCHYPEWRFQPADALADFGLHHLLVVGTPLPIPLQGGEELVGQLGNFQVTLEREGRKIAQGIGMNVLGNQLYALNFLNQILNKGPAADYLSAGEIVTTGTFTPAFPIAPRESWAAEVTGLLLPPLNVQFVGRL